MRLKELQKNRLMAVHDALVVVLEEMKASGEVSVHCLATMGLTHKNSLSVQIYPSNIIYISLHFKHLNYHDLIWCIKQ